MGPTRCLAWPLSLRYASISRVGLKGSSVGDKVRFTMLVRFLSNEDSRVASSVYAPAVPLPTSFPSFFRPVVGSGSGGSTRPATACMTSTLASGGQTAQLLERSALAVTNCIKYLTAVAAPLEKDDLTNLADELLTIHDAHAIDDDSV